MGATLSQDRRERDGLFSTLPLLSAFYTDVTQGTVSNGDHRQSSSPSQANGESPKKRASKSTGKLPLCGSGLAFLYVEVRHLESVVLNKLTTRLNHVAHQSGKHLVAFFRVSYRDLKQRTGIGIQGGFP